MYTCDNIHFKGYPESFTFDKYFFFPFPALVYKRFDNNWIFKPVWTNTGEAVPHHQRDAGVAWWKEALPRNLREKKLE